MQYNIIKYKCLINKYPSVNGKYKHLRTIT